MPVTHVEFFYDTQVKGIFMHTTHKLEVYLFMQGVCRSSICYSISRLLQEYCSTIAMRFDSLQHQARSRKGHEGNAPK